MVFEVRAEIKGLGILVTAKEVQFIEQITIIPVLYC